MGFAIVSWTAADIYWTAVYADDAERRPTRASPTRSGSSSTPPASSTLVPAGALAHAQRPREPVARRPDRRRRRRRRSPPPSATAPSSTRAAPATSSAAVLTEPRLPGRRPAAAGHDRRDLRPVAAGARAAPGSCSASGSPSTRSATASTWSRPRDGTYQDGALRRRALARLLAAGRPGRLAAGQVRQRPERSEPARGDRPGRAAALVAVGLLAYDHFSRLNGLTVDAGRA